MTMHRGAFAIFDALGVRGIWKRFPREHEKVIAKFEALTKAFDEFVETHYRGQQAKDIMARAEMIKSLPFAFLSDTVAAGLVMKPWPGEDEEERLQFQGTLDGFAIYAVASLAAEVMRLGAEIEPGWAYRGCISFGDFAISDSSRFFIGPAVDDAAEHMDAAQGAFVWLTPEARSIVAKNRDPERVDVLTRHRVPIKGQGELDTFVVSPFQGGPPDADEALVSKLLSTFNGSSLDVEMKRQNTEAFLTRHLAEYRAANAKAEEQLRALKSRGVGG